MQRHPIRHETFSIDVLVNMIFGHVPALLKRATCYAAVFDKPGCVTQATAEQGGATPRSRQPQIRSIPVLGKRDGLGGTLRN